MTRDRRLADALAGADDREGRQVERLQLGRVEPEVGAHVPARPAASARLAMPEALDGARARARRRGRARPRGRRLGQRLLEVVVQRHAVVLVCP